MISNIHGQLNAYVVVIVLLAIVMGGYGFLNLSTAFKVPNSRVDIERSDKFVIGVFNIIISAGALFLVLLASR
ncbi:hypothetical protein [Mucilaginibacter aquaedulcis]|uniref:hypothetical protein n=1 Tax=Mucilaginibacter aquaedulcis TaxID=1187081 RepID=UPI0025B5F4DB|nr:hypothetical protein [Mucilaginibacter aquaedulcis]MDN3550330.1 hypothetical protein [Mucilaginibacter aquaedulcis]